MGMGWGKLTSDAFECRFGMLAYMKRTTVKLPDDIDARLRHEAARRGTTIAEVMREAIEAHLGGGGRRRLMAAKAGRSGRRDTARRIEEIIRRELGR
jgi:predicted transcriptional regulator